eukprot:364912-Chlamydomonas_euryale.AAC.12
MHCCRGPLQRSSHASIHPRGASVGGRSSAPIHAAHVPHAPHAPHARRLEHAHGDRRLAVDCSSWQRQQQQLKQQPHADAGICPAKGQAVTRAASGGAAGSSADTSLHGTALSVATPLIGMVPPAATNLHGMAPSAATSLHGTGAPASSGAVHAAPHAAEAAALHAEPHAAEAAAVHAAPDCANSHPLPASRRSALATAVASMVAAAAAATAWMPPPAHAIPLAPLGPAAPVAGPPKARGLSAEQVKQVLQADIAERQYFVTGRLSQDIFSDNCRCGVCCGDMLENAAGKVVGRKEGDERSGPGALSFAS